MSLADRIIGHGKVVASSVLGAAKAVMLTIRGVGDVSDDDDAAEGSQSEAAFGVPGFFFRPDPANDAGYVEVVFVKFDDEMRPIGYRDLRLTKRTNPAEGELGISHYGGGLFSFKWNADKTGSMLTLLAPILSGDTITQSHGLTMDTSPGNRSICLAHMLGAALFVNDDGELVLKNTDGSQTIMLKAGEISMNGIIKLFGGIVAGNSTSAQPTLIASTAQFAWFAQITLAVSQLAAYVNGLAPGTVTPVTAPPPVQSTTLKASPV